jgi:hypothetical protein
MNIECERCDGCGWYEGGSTIQTQCEVCGGTGAVEREATLIGGYGNGCLTMHDRLLAIANSGELSEQTANELRGIAGEVARLEGACSAVLKSDCYPRAGCQVTAPLCTPLFKSEDEMSTVTQESERLKAIRERLNLVTVDLTRDERVDSETVATTRLTLTTKP